MPLEQRYTTETAKWDAIAQQRGAPEDLWVLNADFYAYTSACGTTPGMGEFVGDLDGSDVLELGCGLGELTILLALSGARVTALDISRASVEVAKRRAELYGVIDSIKFIVGPAEDLPFDDESFDVVVGKAVLHHLDATLGAAELHRVLRPDGRAAFAEPLGTNPLIEFAREHLPYPGKNPHGADRPLTRADLDAWEAPFHFTWRVPVHLLAMLERATGREHRVLRRLDGHLLRRAPWLWPCCGYVVLLMVK